MQDKREHILDTAEDLFSEHGFEGTSTRMLAAKAGVNVAMISYYFGSKEKLFEALVDSRTRYTREKLQMLNEGSITSWEKINTAIDIYVDRFLTNHKFHKIFFREVSLEQRNNMSEEIMGLISKNFNELKKIITDGQVSGDFRDVDVEYTISSLFGTISHVTLSCKLSMRLLGCATDSDIGDEVNKQRLKKHLKEMMHSHLKK